ncbi:glycosyltransferase family 4 protein [Mariprofundus ferrooxydans]|nr:glycosyltransferase family 4 protein [Mariprofundus ferrooxydans]
MKIIIVAENASECFGGEAIIPLHYFRLLTQRGHDVWLVTHSRVRSELEKTLSPELLRYVHFMPDTWMHKLLFYVGEWLPHRLNVMTVEAIMFLISELFVRKYIRQKIVDEDVDVVHQPYPVASKRPTMIYDVGVPVVIGPMNGDMNFPSGFTDMESRFEQFFVRLLRYSSDFANRVIPGKKRAAALIVANQRTMNALPVCSSSHVYVMSENGVNISCQDKLSKNKSDRISAHPEFVYLGRLIDWKNVETLIQALAIVLTKTDAYLTIIGDGTERNKIESIVAETGLEEHVHFLGFLPQAEALPRLRKSIALLLPSLYECGGAVVLEAMANETPVIATNWGGPSDYLNEKSGILIHPESEEQMINDFAKAMLSLIENPELCRSMGQEGRKIVERDFSWEKKIDMIESIYQEAIDNHVG